MQEIEIKEAKLEKIASKVSEYPKGSLPEIAFVGRSNVGKSSLLNYLCGRKNLARVSGTPGKTRTINFYRVNGDDFRIVDLPGYGYAKASKTIKSGWDEMISSYFESGKNLCGAVQLVDIRHKPSRLDIMMYEYLKAFFLPFVICATKADKLSNNEKQKALSDIRKTFGLGERFPVIVTSSLKRMGAEELLEAIGHMVYSDRLL
jgi:GTP-binding protein